MKDIFICLGLLCTSTYNNRVTRFEIHVFSFNPRPPIKCSLAAQANETTSSDPIERIEVAGQALKSKNWYQQAWQPYLTTHLEAA